MNDEAGEQKTQILLLQPSENRYKTIASPVSAD